MTPSTTRPVLVIAEAGVNHNGDLDMAHRLIDAAAGAGAGAVKFQTFRADRLASDAAPKADYQRAATGGAETQRDMLRRLELSAEAHLALQAHCANHSVEFLSTPFDEESADFLVSIGVRRIKIPSGEVVNLPFLDHLARFGLPILMSTGMADLEEVGRAVAAVRRAGAADLTLLQCTTDYPARPEDANLRAMATMASAFGTPVGYSDHTPGIECALGAVALGAVVIEKHLTLDCSLPGPDHAASLEPAALAALVRGVRIVEAALGDGVKRPVEAELRNRAAVRKGLVAARPLAGGHRIGPGDLAVRRPGTGLPPAALEEVTGRTLRRPLAEGAPLAADDLA